MEQLEAMERVSRELMVRECVATKHPEFVCPLSESGQGRWKGSGASRRASGDKDGARPPGVRFLMSDPVVAADGCDVLWLLTHALVCFCV